MQIYAVGGAVRDKLLGRPVKDRDWVVVGSVPQQMERHGFTQVGANFPVFLDKKGEEYALARIERKIGPGYNGFETDFGVDVTLEEDLYRRDLTINAMASDVDGNIIDPFNGQEDLKNGILRHVSDAFADDPVRVLRVARFAARYCFQVAPETMELMKRLVDSGELDHLTPERIWAELEKALTELHPNLFFWTLQKCGAYDVLFPELGRTLIETGRAVDRGALFRSPVLHLEVALFSFVSEKVVEEFLTRLTVPIQVIKLTKKFQLLMNLLNKNTNINGAFGVWNASPEDIVKFLHKTHMFNASDDLLHLNQILSLFTNQRNMERMEKILTWFAAIRHVGFSSLTSIQQNELKGKNIGKAIDVIRCEIISNSTYF